MKPFECLCSYSLTETKLQLSTCTIDTGYNSLVVRRYNKRAMIALVPSPEKIVGIKASGRLKNRFHDNCGKNCYYGVNLFFYLFGFVT